MIKRQSLRVMRQMGVKVLGRVWNRQQGEKNADYFPHE
jgi:hypothetical protein